MFKRQLCISFSDLSRPIAVQNQSKERKYRENFRVSVINILRAKVVSYVIARTKK